jgi:splicing factor 3B subunit 3
LLRCLDAGKLSDTRQRFLGTRPPRLFAVWVRGVRSLLALSSRPWLGYTDMGRWQFMPLSYEALDHAAVSTPHDTAVDG